MKRKKNKKESYFDNISSFSSIIAKKGSLLMNKVVACSIL